MSALRDLQEWYAAQCDGDWEHGYGIRIESLDNPGWLVRINLMGTNLGDERLDRIVSEDGLGSWSDIQVRDGVWQAACDPSGLERAIRSFLDWSRTVKATGGRE